MTISDLLSIRRRYIGNQSAASESFREGPATGVDRRRSGNVVTVLTVPIRQLGESERVQVERVLDRDPYAGAQIAERVAAHGLSWWRSDGSVFGYGPGRRVESIVWSGAHLVPVCSTPSATAAFAELLGATTHLLVDHRAVRRRARPVGQAGR